jgi:hypothetical protein
MHVRGAFFVFTRESLQREKHRNEFFKNSNNKGKILHLLVDE